MHMIEFLVKNTYIMVQDTCFQQNIGIPMGTNAGVNMVDFYLTKYELDFMVQLLNKQRWDMLNNFSTTMRYVDDILSVDNASFKQLLYIENTLDGLSGIYPRTAVTLQLVDNASTLNYMDIQILRDQSHNIDHFLHNKLYTRSYDKRDGEKYRKLNITKYPSSRSLIAHKVSYNIILSQCHRFVILDTYRVDFIRDAVRLFWDLSRNGFDNNKLCQRFKHFLLSYRTRLIYGSKPISLFREFMCNLWDK